MDIKDKVTVVTGGASGIGEAICRRFAKEGARGVVVVDRNVDGAKRVAGDIGGIAMYADVTSEDDVIEVVKRSEKQFGHIDLFFSNAGILANDPDGPSSPSNEDWQNFWDVNLMAHVYAARAVLPGMLARGEGYIAITASAAGLLNQIGSTPYSVTKAAAISFAECLAISHGDEGIKVSILCPQAVRTAMIDESDVGVAGTDGMLEPSEVADSVIECLAGERFLFLPHPVVDTYMKRKANDYDRWLKGMRRFRKNFIK